jgi:hypothetical protein
MGLGGQSMVGVPKRTISFCIQWSPSFKIGCCNFWISKHLYQQRVVGTTQQIEAKLEKSMS